ncbi:MAG TPA: GNAT family N-acetyltransferase [Dehalococcoidia bacterium]|jgi:ribosomal protein S18 acetylase RimI-like enzyme
MPVIQCICGERMEGVDSVALFNALRTHNDSAHAAMEISDEELQRVVEAGKLTSTWDGKPVEVTREAEIRELEPGMLGDFLQFFDRDAFMDNPMWSSCYCLYYHTNDQDAWEKRTAEENRRDKSDLIRTGVARGLLAYVDGKPAAWCHAARRTGLPSLDAHDDTRIEDDPATVGSIVCFVVAAPYRRQGIATALLDRACVSLRDMGMTIAEAYPPREASSDARNYHGPLDMYLAARFKPHKVGEHYAIVRKALVEIE